jgi:hypothetical protein
MHDFLWEIGLEWRSTWLRMLAPPWPNPSTGRRSAWFSWLVGWAWTLAGVIGGALLAPTIVQAVGLTNTAYQDWLVIGFAALVGIVVQSVGVTLVTLVDFVPFYGREDFWNDDKPWPIELMLMLLLVVSAVVAVVLPLAGVGYGIYRYLTWIGPGQRTVTIAFVGGLLIKTFLVPFIKSLVTGTLFKLIVRLLRGKNTKKAG